MSERAGNAGAGHGLVIVGAGLAGYTVARELRKLDRERPITIVARDGGDFYAKPSLSNALAQRKLPDAMVTSSASQIASQLGITLRARAVVEQIDAGNRTLHTTEGSIGYDQLVLAVGADPIRLPIAGDAADAVFQVNDLDDYRRFRAALGTGGRVTILGGGLIGSEFANDLRAAGNAVDVVDLADRPLAALLPDEAGRWFANRLAAAGVRWHFGDAAQALSRHEGALALQLRGGASLRSDAVLSAVGLRPRAAMAAAAGLAVDRGILVDRFGATSNADIFALGDCAQYETGLMPYVQPIMVAARALAATLSGTPTPIDFGPMPVVVKTPACPVTVLAPSPRTVGRWEIEASANDALAMEYLDARDRLQGFALLGAASARRREFVQRLGKQSTRGALAA